MDRIGLNLKVFQKVEIRLNAYVSMCVVCSMCNLNTNQFLVHHSLENRSDSDEFSVGTSSVGTRIASPESETLQLQLCLSHADLKVNKKIMIRKGKTVEKIKNKLFFYLQIGKEQHCCH